MMCVPETEPFVALSGRIVRGKVILSGTSSQRPRPLRLGREFTKTDDKGRVVIPQRMREALGPSVTLTSGLLGELLCFSDEDFDSYIAGLREKCYSEDDWWTIKTAMEQPAEHGHEIKPNGRLTIPEHLRKELHIDGNTEVVLVWDSSGHLQIWRGHDYAEMRKNPAEYKAKNRTPLRRMVLRPSAAPHNEPGV